MSSSQLNDDFESAGDSENEKLKQEEQKQKILENLARQDWLRQGTTIQFVNELKVKRENILNAACQCAVNNEKEKACNYLIKLRAFDEIIKEMSVQS